MSDFLFIELYSLRLTFAIEIEVVPRENKDGQYPIYVDIPSENESAFKKWSSLCSGMFHFFKKKSVVYLFDIRDFFRLNEA